MPAEPVLLIPDSWPVTSSLKGMSMMLRGPATGRIARTSSVNMGCTLWEAADRPRASRRVDRDGRGRKVSIVGHSLGGMLARALAARSTRPDHRHRVDAAAIGRPALCTTYLAWDAEMLTRLTRAGFGA